ncbi:hypothetical protein AcW1_001289 [Taiwanofungus camphoratus]|nr:hypothetical protein AcW2_000186 [Antrodia cinnamomea]KAI0937268.1 hypothetical protein AcV5_005211 [Antrodia cinnamomea]KAI0962476.1 hypothetical protein AcV7_001311 [Antrodia cinnamomea]KAI0964480.1 hypothetical protein AcW1_001289 [Antrodia cinnamomea]
MILNHTSLYLTRNMSKLDLATAEDVLVYVAETQFASKEATPLTGGFGNYAFRLHLHVPFQGHDTVVLKHAKPYIPGLREMEFAVERQVYEVAALKQMREWLSSDTFVSVPEVFLFDQTANVIIMQDCGENSLTLKQFLQDSPPSVVVADRIGAALGELIGRLHTRGSNDNEFLGLFVGNEKGRKLSASVTYDRLVSTLTNGRLPALSDPPLEVSQEKLNTISIVAKQTGHAMLTTTETIVMGDFWPGNVLVVLDRNKDGNLKEIKRVYVVDWEMAKPGLAGLDIGQFCAELHLLCEFKPESREAASTLLSSFLRGYREAYTVNLHVARTAIVHVGAHLVAWTPRISWGSKEKIREVVQEGVDLLVEGCMATKGYIGESILGALLQ